MVKFKPMNLNSLNLNIIQVISKAENLIYSYKNDNSDKIDTEISKKITSDISLLNKIQKSWFSNSKGGYDWVTNTIDVLNDQAMENIDFGNYNVNKQFVITLKLIQEYLVAHHNFYELNIKSDVDLETKAKKLELSIKKFNEVINGNIFERIKNALQIKVKFSTPYKTSVLKDRYR